MWTMHDLVDTSFCWTELLGLIVKIFENESL